MPCWTEQECDDYRREHEVEFQSDSEFEKAAKAGADGTAARPTRRGGPAEVRRIELHEVKTLNKHLARLRDEFGLRADVLLPTR